MMKLKKLTIALAGNSNVGKSVIFNQLTGLHQHIGNWPGKTVEKSEGTLQFRDYIVDIVDLPGIYSLSTFSLEELVTREYIAEEKPDIVINIVDASVLERNLFFTIQLMELGRPMVIGLNQIDLAEKKGRKINFKELENILGVPVVPTVAIKGKGVYELLEKAIDVIEKGGATPKVVKYGTEVENRVDKLADMISKMGFKYPPRWTVIKLLEGDEQVIKMVEEAAPAVIEAADKTSKEIERIHGHSCSTVITSERYELANRIAGQVQDIALKEGTSLTDTLDTITTHRVFGYPIMIAFILSIFLFIFSFGNYTSNLLSGFFYGWEPFFERALGGGILKELVWGGFMAGIIAGITIALPYIAPFYIILHILEDSGYLSRIAFLTDGLMHKIGLHGKAFIPIMLGYGCNVPGCLGCRIMETQRERLLAAFVTTLVPCSARTIVILGLVGAFVGFQWAVLLYVIDLLIIFFLGRLAFRVLPGEPTALIMEMSDYKVPHTKTVGKETWFDLKDFIKISFPLIIVGSVALKILDILKLLNPIATLMSPVTVTWLGLPVISGIVLIFGVLRKELTLVMLASLLGTANFAQILAPIQMMVFTLVIMLYIPCIATITALVKEFGYKTALTITIFEVAFAVFVGGVFLRLLALSGIL